MGRAKRICYLSPMRAAKVQASLRIRAVSPEPSLLAHTSSELRGTFRQKAKSLAPLNDWACAVKICHDGMLEDTNSLGGAQIAAWWTRWLSQFHDVVYCSNETCHCILFHAYPTRFSAIFTRSGYFRFTRMGVRRPRACKTTSCRTSCRTEHFLMENVVIDKIP